MVSCFLGQPFLVFVLAFLIICAEPRNLFGRSAESSTFLPVRGRRWWWWRSLHNLLALGLEMRDHVLDKDRSNPAIGRNDLLHGLGGDLLKIERH
jgi:hypothetical protein